MACAFGMEACKHYYSVKYVRLPDLLLDLQAARDNGAFATTLKIHQASTADYRRMAIAETHRSGNQKPV